MDGVHLKTLMVAQLTVHNRANNSPHRAIYGLLRHTHPANSLTTTSFRLILILFSHLLPALRSGLLPSEFPKTYAFPTSPRVLYVMPISHYLYWSPCNIQWTVQIMTHTPRPLPPQHPVHRRPVCTQTTLPHITLLCDAHLQRPVHTHNRLRGHQSITTHVGREPRARQVAQTGEKCIIRSFHHCTVHWILLGRWSQGWWYEYGVQRVWRRELET
jgi:hypothetical protein